MSIYIGNVPYEVSQDDLKQVFSDYGAVSRVTLPVDRDTGRMRGFAFVEMSSDAEENSAIEALDGAEWMGRNLKVSKARPREANGGGGGNFRSGDRGDRGSFSKKSSGRRSY